MKFKLKKRSGSGPTDASTVAASKNALGDKASIMNQRRKKTRSKTDGCFGGGIDNKKIAKAIEKDDQGLLEQLISRRDDVLEHVDEDGRTLLHQCVENTYKYGTLYSDVGRYLVSQGCSLKAKDKDDKTVLEDAYEKGQHLLLSCLIGAYMETEIQQGRMEPLPGKLEQKDGDGNRTVINNFKLLKWDTGKWSDEIHKGCEAYITLQGESNLTVIDESGEECLRTTINSIKQLQVRNRGMRVVMQLVPEDEAEENCVYLLKFKKDVDAYYFASLFLGVEQSRKNAKLDSD